MACVCSEENDKEPVLEQKCSELPKFPDWMGGLDAKLHSLPLNRIAIPGSHDSFTSTIDKTGPVAPSCPRALQELVKLFGGRVKDLIYRWSVTQSLGVTEQLEAGVRYFDIRLSRKPKCEGFYVVHGFYGSEITETLTELRRFLDAHPREVVILDMNHFYEMSEDDHLELLAIVESVLEGKLCPLLDVASVTLEMLWENNLQVLVIYQAPPCCFNLQFWPGSMIRSPWADTPDPFRLLGDLQRWYTSGYSVETFSVTQGVLSPDTAFVISHLTSSLRDALAEKVAKPFISWLRQKTCAACPDTDLAVRGINVCIMDYVQLGEYIPTVIKLNNTLL